MLLVGGVFLNTHSAAAQNITLEEMRDLLTIEWVDSPADGIDVPPQLQTGIKEISQYTNPIIDVTIPTGGSVEANIFDDYVAVSPSIFYSDTLLGEDYYLLFVLEREDGAMLHNIAVIPISSEYDFSSNIIQFFSTIQIAGANLITSLTEGIESSVRTDNSQGFPEGPLYVRAYLNGGNFLNQLYDEFELGEYLTETSSPSDSTIETLGAEELETSAIDSPGLVTPDTASEAEFITTTLWRLKSFDTMWDIEHEEHELGGYVYNGFVRSRMLEMGQGVIDFIITPLVPIHNPNSAQLRNISFDGTNQYSGNTTAVLNFENHDDAEQETPILQPDRNVYMAVVYNDNIMSFRRVQNYQQPDTYIDIEIEKKDGARIVYYDPADSLPKISFKLTINTQVPIENISLRLNTDWGQGVIIDSFNMSSNERVVQYSLGNLIESTAGNTEVQTNTPYYLTVYADGNIVAGDYIGMVEVYEDSVPASQTVSVTSNQDAQSGAVSVVQSGSIGDNPNAGSIEGAQSGSIGENPNQPTSGVLTNPNIGNPQVTGGAAGALDVSPSMSISDAGLIPCGRRYGPNNTNVPCTFSHIVILIQNLISFAFVLVMPIAAVVFMYAGFLLITSGSSPDKRTKARGIFGKAIIGIIFIMAAWLIVSLVLQTLGVDEPFRLLDF